MVFVCLVKIECENDGTSHQPHFFLYIHRVDLFYFMFKSDKYSLSLIGR